MNTHSNPNIALVARSTDPTCAYHNDCQCYKQTRHAFYAAKQGQHPSTVTPVLLTRDEIVDDMVDLFADAQIDRMWIQNTPDNAQFLWFAPNPDTRIGDWCVDFEGHTYTFQWQDLSETVHCNTLGDWFGPIDPFGDRLWSSHREAVVWTLDNIHHIAERS